MKAAQLISEENSAVDLTVDLNVPIPTEPTIPTPDLTFYRWLPIGMENGIQVKDGRFELFFWFDNKSHHCGNDDISRHINVLVDHIRVRITVRQVRPDIVIYIRSRPHQVKDNLWNDYLCLCKEVLDVFYTHINRLIRYVRSVKGQFWIVEFPHDTGRVDRLIAFNAVTNVNGQQVRFGLGSSEITLTNCDYDDRYLTETDWIAIGDFVRRGGSTLLVDDLLVGAEQLAHNGYCRSALTQAVTALEVAVNCFGKRYAKQTQTLSRCVGIETLEKQINRLGLTLSIRCLIPLLLPEEILSTQILSGCSDAISARQMVVHNGQRVVRDIIRYLDCIRKCCKTLMEQLPNTSEE